MSNFFRKRSALVGLACAALAGCTSAAGPSSGDATGARAAVVDGVPISVSYRGHRQWAVPRDGSFVIEGDIIVAASELDDVSVGNDKPGKITSRVVSLTGSASKWTDGVVRYSLANVQTSPGVTVETAKAKIREAIGWWASRVPGLHFIEQSGACPSGQCLDIRAGANEPTSSGQGAGSPQVSQVGNGTALGTTAHELGHALGLYHENQRSDRGGYIQIVWGKLWGCLNSATSEAGCGSPACEGGSGTPRQNAINNGCCLPAMFNNPNGTAIPDDGTSAAVGICYKYTNLIAETPQATRTPYDFDSIMHYGTSEWSKDSSPTIVPIVPVPPGVTIGADNHLSVLDIAGMNVLYPTLTVNKVLFRNTGVQRLAQLTGREQDIDVSYTCTSGSLSTGATINTASLTEGTSSFSCTVKSPLWKVGYNYPNSTNTTMPSSGFETFASVTSTKVLNAGLITVFTTEL